MSVSDDCCQVKNCQVVNDDIIIPGINWYTVLSLFFFLVLGGIISTLEDQVMATMVILNIYGQSHLTRPSHFQSKMT